MSRKRSTIEQIINHLRAVEVLLSQGRTVGEVCRRIGISAQSYYRWRKEYGGLKVNQARRLKELEQENARRAAAGIRTVPVDTLLLAALEAGMPDCAGVALGVDRLFQALTGADSLDDVMTFPIA